MAKRESNLLSDIQLRQWMRAAQPIAKSDGGGLTFTLSESGTATWVLRFRHGGRRQELTLGRYPDLSLSAARAAAAKKRVGVVEGVNPADEVRKAKAKKDVTVRQLAKDYEDKKLSTFAISTQRSYGRNLKRVVNGMGGMSVQSVGPADIVAELERHDLGWVETFTLWCVLRGMFEHAAGKKIIVVSPCAGIRLESIIGKRPPVKPRLMLTDDEIHVLTNATMRDVNLYAVRIALATGVRISELYTALKTNLFLAENRWHVPETKTDAAMDIPLAPIVVQWFERLLELSGNSDYVLPARLSNRLNRHDGDTHVSKDAIREAIDYWIENHQPAIRRFTPHDLRSTMKSHMRKLKVSRDISEMCLNHKLPGVEGIYDQYTYWDERRDALVRWAAHITKCMHAESENMSQKAA
ncbi:tyrosine-type recombinase/integrase [Burkholderia multivorans]|uniref:tyrosine-type recombinase/integrase n=2 Tax=Burkholderia multivorans TaxID=87883 RepID=UPI00209E9292|nr:site-specific integrase [Burkholderia multivorans]MCO8353490.1 tyrosine-type recombinase/integrase [Burkholderia multivorans]MCO8385749.1 tyrosine-type recombinase/integrase [Burkholderia multivorans]MCO8406570.1 tyrosine-type recombinase/integrase [Burkholderia multivorans]MCO8434845.1 tyrosine-type recombinase/integrase [Burkholderia multivorans]MCO8460679.1 tyrosine-type recombinase/integrase [Burkholderia multivorans]